MFVSENTLQMLFVADNVLVMYQCDSRDSRGKCLHDNTLVQVLARNGTGTEAVERTLLSANFGICLTPQQMQFELDRSYLVAVKSGKYDYYWLLVRCFWNVLMNDFIGDCRHVIMILLCMKMTLLVTTFSC